MEATQQTQRRESTFLTLVPHSEAKTVASASSPIDDANPLSSPSEVVPTIKTQRSTSDSSTSSDSTNRFLRLGHADE
ncbi:uncharacterized protein RCC_07029 [Ramularia collo-cygni]|uniref:Uncharacterized protein n=1 Tax=Ramularia collo-cygni TaxID=112498 RepID=A0A2D3V062_9PEZI|nr:uncharacterized protein RCC_07029 [Ramularia collo-cygni]CZT21168.1 uncharacterized protein RCC_07029 [Ramularia collo-cygni]